VRNAFTRNRRYHTPPAHTPARYTHLMRSYLHQVSSEELAIAERLAPIRNRIRRYEVAMTKIVTTWPTNWPHEQPEQPLTVNEAHHTMQHHRACLREECERKQAAWEILVEAGRVRPDPGRTR